MGIIMGIEIHNVIGCLGGFPWGFLLGNDGS
jgi:hypothetical protein